MLFEQADRRHEARALQTFLVQVIRRDVGGCDQRDAALEQPAEQVAEQHRIGDVGDEQLVEAQDARLLRDPVGDAVERVGLLLVLLQLVVHRLHEAVEVAALLVAERQALEEQIHQPRLAAADAAPHIEPTLQLVLFAAGEQLAEQSLRFCGDQPVCATHRTARRPWSCAGSGL